MAGLHEGARGGEAAEVCANNDDVEAEHDTATSIEWRDLLDGDVSRDLRWGIFCVVICGKKRSKSEGRGVALSF